MYVFDPLSSSVFGSCPPNIKERIIPQTMSATPEYSVLIIMYSYMLNCICHLSSLYDRMPKLKRKNDFVVWCYLSELQQNIYRSFSEQDEIKEVNSPHQGGWDIHPPSLTPYHAMFHIRCNLK